MRTHERIKSMRNHLQEQIPRENIWYFSEGSSLNPSSVPEKKTWKRNNENNAHFISRTPERSNLSRECSFVVDWQLSDSF